MTLLLRHVVSCRFNGCRSNSGPGPIGASCLRVETVTQSQLSVRYETWLESPLIWHACINIDGDVCSSSAVMVICHILWANVMDLTSCAESSAGNLPAWRVWNSLLRILCLASATSMRQQSYSHGNCVRVVSVVPSRGEHHQICWWEVLSIRDHFY